MRIKSIEPFIQRLEETSEGEYQVTAVGLTQVKTDYCTISQGELDYIIKILKHYEKIRKIVDDYRDRSNNDGALRMNDIVHTFWQEEGYW